MRTLYISKREKVILDVLLNQNNGVTIDYLSEKLDVSTRTVYRELSSLESTLAQYQLKLIKDSDGYHLKGKQVFVDELREDMQGSADELTTKQRQSLLVIKLLLEEQEVKMEALAYELGVSSSTIQLDLQSIEEMFEDYNIEIVRKKARGIKAHSSEPNVRLIISGLIASELNEYNFFRLFDGNLQVDEDRYEKTNNPFLKVIDVQALELAFSVVKQYDRYQFDEVTDTQFQSLVLFLAVSMMRMKKGHLITEEELKQRTKETSREKSIQLAKYLLEKLQREYKIRQLSKEEAIFLAVQIEGLNVPLRNEFSEDYDIQLSYKIRELIRKVSQETSVDFQVDDTLFKDLLAHLSAAISRNQAPMPEQPNPLLEKIYEEFTDLSHTVERYLKELFPDVDFHSNEVLYVVIHFASAYERNPKSQKLRVLIICSSGMGTAKILESRLRKNVPEITDVDISRISQLYELDYEEYDLILSTIFLQGFEEEYKVVTPLLMEDEMKSIKRYVAQILEAKMTKRVKREKLSLQQDVDNLSFKEFYTKVADINRILETFDVKSVEVTGSLKDTLLSIAQALNSGVIHDPIAVVAKLEKRMQTAPIGLPGTHMALFHCIDEAVKRPYFGIFDLSSTFEIENMEKESMELKRVLLMMAPEPLDESIQEIMGTISSAIVESTFNLQMFDTGRKDLLQHYLSGLFLGKVK